MRFSVILVTAAAVLTVQGWVAPRPSHRARSLLATSSFRGPPSLYSQQISNSEATALDTEFSADELIIFIDLQDKAKTDGSTLRKVLMEALPSMTPSLILKLRRSGSQHEKEAVREIAHELEATLEASLEQAKETLSELLDAGEIRKLDSLVGKAAKEGKLDMAFFNVLTANLQDAQISESAGPVVADFEQGNTASRLQILQHVYTRCQEEVEKLIPAGTALLNKLLRTDQAAIRANLYRHYLTPQKSTIETPDGKTLELQGMAPVLVPPTDFCDAIGQAVKQIRTVEQVGGTDREMAANMVETFRTLAKEARIIIGTEYGLESAELIAFEEGLQPVFRPNSPDSPYIQGEAGGSSS